MPTVESSGTDIYYEVNGEGPAILFAHGAGGNAAIWFQQVAHFNERFTCIAFDHRCFARTHADPSSISVPQFRDDALAILDALNIEQAHLVGQSMGGFTCLRLALDYPDRVASLTMSCTPGGLPNPNPSSALRRLVASTGRGTDGVRATMAKATFENKALLQLYLSIAAFNTEFAWEYLASLGVTEDQVSLEQVKGIKCPVMFVSGAEDPLFPPELLASYVPHFANAKIETVQDAGHSPYFEQPDVFNALLEGFIRQADEGNRGVASFGRAAAPTQNLSLRSTLR
ncbi:MAG: alpha/beta hydrolase [Gammaproteobacteria bacterium]|nr:alpha/beta hydrolase [Gammaproteobacteria bacterium]